MKIERGGSALAAQSLGQPVKSKRDGPQADDIFTKGNRVDSAPTEGREPSPNQVRKMLESAKTQDSDKWNLVSETEIQNIIDKIHYPKGPAGQLLLRAFSDRDGNGNPYFTFENQAGANLRAWLDQHYELPSIGYGRITTQDAERAIARAIGGQPNAKVQKAFFDDPTPDNWTIYEKQLWKLPRAPSSHTEQLLEWAVTEKAASSAAYPGVAQYLRSTGYLLDPDKPPTPEEIGQIKASSTVPSDAEFEKLFQMCGHSEREVTVGVLDGGFDLRHPEVKKTLKMKNGEVEAHVGAADVCNEALRNQLNGGADDHGNTVLAIATKGTKMVKAVPVAGMGIESGVAEPDELKGALKSAVESGATVINTSFHSSFPETVTVWRQFMQDNPQVLFVVAAGNSDSDTNDLPQAQQQLFSTPLPNLVVVAAHDRSGERMRKRDDISGSMLGSNYGDAISLAAGSEFYAPRADFGYGESAMTSMAAPNVTNCAAKMQLLAPTLTAERIRNILVKSAETDARWIGNVEAGGRLDTTTALNSAAIFELRRKGKTDAVIQTMLNINQRQFTHAAAALL